jgi:hypothetical protein
VHSPFCAEIVPDSVTPGLLVMFVAEVNARQFSQLPSASALAGTNPRSRESVAFRKRGIMIDAVVLETPRCTEAPPPFLAEQGKSVGTRPVRGDQASPWGPGQSVGTRPDSKAKVASGVESVKDHINANARVPSTDLRALPHEPHQRK